MEKKTLPAKNNLSIITITYNSSNRIIRLLESLELEKKNIAEIIIIENNSPDSRDTKRKILLYEVNSLNKIKFINNKRNIGFGKACNIGVKNISSENILFLNPDCEIEYNSLGILLTHLSLNNADIIGGKTLNYSSQSHRSAFRAPNLSTGLFDFSNLGKILSIQGGTKHFYYGDKNILENKDDTKVGGVSGAFLLIKKKSFNLLNGFDKEFFMYLEDVDLCVRANKSGMKVIFCPHSKILHEGGASSKNKYRIRHTAWFDSRRYYYKKHFNTIANIIIQPVFLVEELLLKVFKKI